MNGAQALVQTLERQGVTTILDIELSFPLRCPGGQPSASYSGPA